MTKRAKRVKGTVGNGYLYSSAGADVLRTATSAPDGIFGPGKKVRKSKKTDMSIFAMPRNFLNIDGKSDKARKDILGVTPAHFLNYPKDRHITKSVLG